MKETNESNSTDGADAFDADSAQDFFEALETEVNSAIADPEVSEGTPQQASGPVKETREVKAEAPKTDTDWEKRYKDSSREAQKMNSRLKQFEPFVPLLDAMKNDGGLVDHVRDYLQNGGKPSKTIRERLQLDEDFVFDANEAVSDPTSDSAKLFEAHVNTAVNQRVGNMMASERKKTAKITTERAKAQAADEFKQRNNMSDEEFGDMMDKANKTPMTLDDIFYLVNKDKVAANVAKSTKEEMLTQMKTVRDIPSSNAGINSAPVDKNLDDDVFDSLKGSDGDLENLFGN